MAGKGDKAHKVVKEIKAELPDLGSLQAEDHVSKNPTPTKSKNASRSVSAQRRSKSPVHKTEPAKKEVQTKIEEHDEEHNASLGKRKDHPPTKTEGEHAPEDSILQRKINTFLDKLKSSEKRDVEDNARMLAKFVQHLACNFSVDTSEIMKVMEAQKGDVEINKVRAVFIKNFH